MDDDFWRDTVSSPATQFGIKKELTQMVNALKSPVPGTGIEMNSRKASSADHPHLLTPVHPQAVYKNGGLRKSQPLDLLQYAIFLKRIISKVK